MITIEEAAGLGPEAADPAYLAWKKRKIETAVQHADAHPEDIRTHKQVFDRIKQNFRP